MNKRILVTGANGFVGKALTEQLLNGGYSVRGVVRTMPLNRIAESTYFEWVAVGNINSKTDWGDALKGVDVVIHAAARVHMMNDNSPDPFLEYREVNTNGTLRLLEAAVTAGVKKFIFVSSIKVNGEQTIEHPFTEDNFCAPDDPYGLSKWEAEQGILNKANSLGIDYTIVRLPLVYGNGVKANFAKLLQLVTSKIPVPFGAIKNKRSLLYIGNLMSAILEIIKNPKSDNQTYLLSDNDDVSTAELVKAIARAFNVKSLLLPVPVSLFKLTGKIMRKQTAVSRLLGSLQVDSGKIREDLSWEPPYTVESGLAEMAKKQSK